MVIDSSLLDELIVGFIPHKIYAFSTPQANEYLKVGDTGRSVELRLEEWRSKIPDLNKEGDWLATVPKEGTQQIDFFRDFALHRYFRNNNFLHLDASVAPGNSKEFYRVTLEDIEKGLQAISDDYDRGMPYEYDYLSIKDNSKVQKTWNRTEDFKLRENQKQVIDNLLTVKDDESVPPNYLLFAVMRFGKTFVALQAAKALKSRLTVVVSAKADVAVEWKQNLESHKDFEGFKFLDSSSLKSNSITLKEELTDSNILLFLTLQDLSGENIKKKHEQVFDSEVDLLIVDESHFGARAQSYGQAILQPIESDDREKDDELEALKNVKAIIRKKTLHLSGTPYRILIGNEFKNPRQIIGKVRFEDILEEKEKWYLENVDEPEWKNPYFGFPQMIRFGFNLSNDAKFKFMSLSKDGSSSQLSELFGTKSNRKNKTDYNIFKHESKVLDILKAFDGAGSSESIFPLLKYDKIQNGKMAQHIVMVLPYKASCDAMELLLKKYQTEFFHLKEYKIINIAGHDSKYNNNDFVKKEIKESANSGQKTISLTVNKMLTGVTVPEWDTMLFLKDTHSPQEYDQAVYRLQSPYVTKQVDNNGETVNKVDLKPQTLLIDFAPNRMMSLEQYKAFILSASDGQVGNDKVQDLLERQMSSSPIITISNDKLVQVRPTDILKYVAEYSSEKGIVEEANDIVVDLSILEDEDVKQLLSKENIIHSKNGISFDAYDSNENEANADDVEAKSDNDIDTITTSKSGEFENAEEENVKKYKNYCLRLLFFAFLSKEEEIHSLNDLIQVYDNNSRLASHLGIRKKDLLLFQNTVKSPYARADLDNKISNANSLLADNSVKNEEKVSRAIRSFARISESEVFTPKNIADEMVEKVVSELKIEDFKKNPKAILDFSSKSGIYLLSFYEKLIKKGVPNKIVKDNLYAITTSPIAYEFTRKVFELMDFPVKNIANIDKITSYNMSENLLEVCKQFKGDNKMKFDIIVGNPPYNESDKNDGKGSSKPLYHHFINFARELEPEVISLITPSVWFLGGKGLDKFRESMLKDIHFKTFTNFITAKDIFKNVSLRGGVNYFIWNKSYDNTIKGVNVTEIKEKKIISKMDRPYSISGINLFISDSIGLQIIYKFIERSIIDIDYRNSEKTMSKYVSERNPFGFSTTFKDFKEENNEKQSLLKIYRSKGRCSYVSPELLNKGQEITQKLKVITPFANNIGTDLPDDNLNTKIIGKNEIVTETYLVIGAKLELTSQTAKFLEKYLKTKFVRYLISLAKANQNGTRQTYRFVPKPNFDESEINWNGSIEELNSSLYNYYKLSDTERGHIDHMIKAI
ncbi:TPA: Eco57I restriction-modification methylase domain-containing protein [Streptococcus suis]